MATTTNRSTRRFRRRGIAALSAMAALALPLGPSGTPAGAAGDDGAGPVAEWGTVTGTDGRVYISDSSGRAQILRGFNMKTDDPANDVTDAILANAAARCMDHIRVAFYWQYLEPEKDQIDEAFLDQLETVLDRAQKHGIRVIFDMHQDVYGEAFGSEGIPTWATRDDGLPFEAQDNWLLSYMQPAVQAAFEHLYEDPDLRQEQIDAWMAVVNRVKDHPNLIGYDLMNEPFGKIREGEDIFTAAARVESEQLTPMYQRLTDAISAVDSDHWVFIEPPNLASLGIATSLGQVHGPKVAFYPHMYDPDIEMATYSEGGKVQINPEFFTKWADAITTYTDKYPMPMLVGEWGIASPEKPGMDAFVDLALKTLEETTSGWSHFQMCWGGGYCPFDSAGNARPNIGRIFQPYPRGIAGRPEMSRWDPNTRTLRISFTDGSAQGPTSIYLDREATYPNGYVVETSDANGSWTQAYDADTDMLSVDTPDTGGRHVICVKPQGSAPGCTAEPTAPPSSTTTTTPGSRPNTAPPARPVSSNPSYTG